jgi:hypothetical protein
MYNVKTGLHVSTVQSHLQALVVLIRTIYIILYIFVHLLLLCLTDLYPWYKYFMSYVLWQDFLYLVR